MNHHSSELFTTCITHAYTLTHIRTHSHTHAHIHTLRSLSHTYTQTITLEWALSYMYHTHIHIHSHLSHVDLDHIYITCRYNYLVFSDNVTVFRLFIFIVIWHRNYHHIICSSCCVFVTSEGLNKDYLLSITNITHWWVLSQFPCITHIHTHAHMLTHISQTFHYPVSCIKNIPLSPP